MPGTVAIAAVLLAAACSGGGTDDPAAPPPARSPLVPTFEASTTTTSTTTPTGGPTTTSTTAPGADPTTTSTTLALIQGGRPEGSASVTDPEGDVTLSVERPPPWADLVAATLTLDESGFELRVSLGGGDAPEASDGDHTMNVASFYDTDGDGAVEYEIWLNLGPEGWGAGYFSPAGARYVDESGVEITTDGGDVVARFPWSHLGEPTAFRWSVASEWGRYETIGTNLAARDDMPDDDGSAAFPA